MPFDQFEIAAVPVHQFPPVTVGNLFLALELRRSFGKRLQPIKLAVVGSFLKTTRMSYWLTRRF